MKVRSLKKALKLAHQIELPAVIKTEAGAYFVNTVEEFRASARNAFNVFKEIEVGNMVSRADVDRYIADKQKTRH